jgi:hypothetical protein
MCSLQIFHAETAEVFLRGENRGMPQDATEEFQVASPSEVLAGKGVTAGMGGDADTR